MAFGKERDTAAGSFEQSTSSDRAGGPVSLIGSGMTVTGNVTVAIQSAVLLGSTTRELMHGAGCPVVIVPRGRALGLGDG